jgi:hypothetical protein
LFYKKINHPHIYILLIYDNSQQRQTRKIIEYSSFCFSTEYIYRQKTKEYIRHRSGDSRTKKEQDSARDSIGKKETRLDFFTERIRYSR